VKCATNGKLVNQSITRVYFDSAPVIALLNQAHIHHTVARERLYELVEKHNFQCYGSLLLRVEVHGKREFALDEMKGFDTLIKRLELTEVEINISIAKEAVRLIAESPRRIAPPDAIHLATALHHNCTHFFTNDRNIRVLPAMTFVTLSDFDA